MNFGYRLQIGSENTFTVYLDAAFTDDMVREIRNLADYLHKQLLGTVGQSNNELACFLDVIPANNNITIEYNPLFIGYKEVQEKLSQLLFDYGEMEQKSGAELTQTKVELPVYYGSEVALDIDDVARILSLTPEKVAQLHSEATYQVVAVGFAPGFAYLDGLHPTLQLPRKANPRKWVPAGSLAIAEGQSAIYPCDSPGGWHIIGHCPIPMFDAKQGAGAKLKFGDIVNYKAISFDEYQSLRIRYSAIK